MPSVCSILKFIPMHFLFDSRSSELEKKIVDMVAFVFGIKRYKIIWICSNLKLVMPCNMLHLSQNVKFKLIRIHWKAFLRNTTIRHQVEVKMLNLPFSVPHLS